VTVEDPTEIAPVDPYAELKFCALHPINCSKAYDLSNQAFQWARDNFPRDSLRNGKGDAARHAYWNCLMTEQLGVDFAKGLGDAHEEGGSGSGNPCGEKLVDLYNNNIGRVLSGQPGSCEEKVLNALDRLKTL
jgi:hypothetical protein